MLLVLSVQVASNHFDSEFSQSFANKDIRPPPIQFLSFLCSFREQFEGYILEIMVPPLHNHHILMVDDWIRMDEQYTIFWVFIVSVEE